MQEVASPQDNSKPKSMSSFKKELASVLKNGPTAKIHMQAKPGRRSPNETDTELYQDTSTLQIVDLPWTSGPVLTELIHSPAATGSSIDSANIDVTRTDQTISENHRESPISGPELEDELRLPPEDCSTRLTPQTDESIEHKMKLSERSTVEADQSNARDMSDAANRQNSGLQIHIRRKNYHASECMSLSDDDDGDNTESEIQYSKLPTPVESKKGFLSRFSFGKSKTVSTTDSDKDQHEAVRESTSKITLEDPGESSDFNVEQTDVNSVSAQKRGILGIGGQLRKSLFKRRAGRSDERDKEGPLQQIRPDDEVDSEDEDVLVFAPSLQILDTVEPEPSPAITPVDTEETKTKPLDPKKLPEKPVKGRPTYKRTNGAENSKWYFQSAEELTRATSGSLASVSKTSLHSVPDETCLKDGDKEELSRTKAKIKEGTRKEQKKIQSMFYRRESKLHDASIEAQQVLEVLRDVEALHPASTNSPEDTDDSGLRQYFEEVLPSSAEEEKKANSFAGAFNWFRRGAKKKSDPKPDVVVELNNTTPRTFDVGVQFPEVDDDRTQVTSPCQKESKVKDTSSRSGSRETLVAQERLWKVPGEQQSSGAKTTESSVGDKISGEQIQAELVFHCPSVHEEFPVVQASHQPAVDYVPGDSLLTLSSLDINDQKLDLSAGIPLQYSSNLKPPKIPIFSGCCPAPNKTVDLSVPYGPTKDNSNHKRKPKAKDEQKSKKDDKPGTKKVPCGGADIVFGSGGDDLTKLPKDTKKNKQRDNPTSPAVAIVKTVAKQVVVKLREREQRKRRHREYLLSIRGGDLLKTRKWRSCPTLTTRSLTSPCTKAATHDCSEQNTRRLSVECHRTRRASC